MKGEDRKKSKKKRMTGIDRNNYVGLVHRAKLTRWLQAVY